MTASETAVANAGPLISLAKIGRFGLLEELFGCVTLPQAVFDEVVRSGAGQPGAKETEEAGWIAVEPVADRLAVNLLSEELGLGESEAIVLAQELGATWLLLDDALARRKAERIGIAIMGTLGVLIIAKNVGIISAVKPVLDELRATDFRASVQVYAQVLARVNEN